MPLSLFPAIVEFFDIAFFRLLWALVVDYLVATGFLLPEQRLQWVEGWGHILGVVFAGVSVAIWQWHSHKKDVTRIVERVETTVTPAAPSKSVFNSFTTLLKRAVTEPSK